MLPFNKAKRTMGVTVVLAISAVFGCSDSIGVNSTAVHGLPAGAVVGPPSSVSISPSSLTLDEGETGALQCTVLDAAGVAVSTAPSWQSSDTTVVAVNSRGNLVARHAGTALASCEMGGRVANSVITVAGRTVAFVEVSPGAGTLDSGGSLQLAGVPRDSLGLPVAGYQVQWSSPDTAVVSVSNSGFVVAKGDRRRKRSCDDRRKGRLHENQSRNDSRPQGGSGRVERRSDVDHGRSFHERDSDHHRPGRAGRHRSQHHVVRGRLKSLIGSDARCRSRDSDGLG